MKNEERTATVAVLAVLLATGISLAQVAGPDEMMKGVEFTRASSLIPYNSSQAHQSLESLRATGANWVTIVPVYWMSDTGAPYVFWMDGQSPTDSEVTQVIRWAKQLGLKVFMKPEVHCLSGVWQGYHIPHSAIWFQTYWFFLMRYARIAQAEECEMLCVGSELDRTTVITGSEWGRTWWPSIINWVKGEYLGPITYAADWRTYRSVPFWDSLDLVGINAYFPPSADSPPGQPDVQNLAEEWKISYIPQIKAFRDSLGLTDSTKPVIFTEIGYRSINGCAAEPWNDTMSGVYDPTEQRNCYIAALHSLLGRPWFAGWFWHEWTTDPYQGGTGDLSYSPKGKPAQEVLRRWSAAIATQRSMSFRPSYDSSTSYQDPSAQASLANLCSTGADWVTILPQGFMSDIGDNYDSIGVFDTATVWPASPCSTSLVQIVDWAKGSGLKVMFKPHVDCISHAYRGLHDPQGETRDRWFDDYREFIVRYARMAELLNCEMFCVGCELNGTTDDQADIELWRDEIIPAVREVYSGPITYAQLGIGNQAQSNRWGDVDFVGVDAYFQLFPPGQYVGSDTASGQTPTITDLLQGENPYNSASWQNTWLPLLETLYRHTERPILFTEVGYQTIDSTAYAGGDARSYSWKAQDTSARDSFFGVHFPWDTMTGYVVGEHGVALRTTNSGTDWTSVSTGTQRTLRSVHFPSMDTGFAVGDTGTIVRFAFGGDPWTELRPPPSGFGHDLSSVFFPNRATGFAVGESGSILRTTNYGAIWSPRISGAIAQLWSVHFPSDSIGFVVGDSGIILKTTDCGTNWSRLSSGTSVPIRSVYFFAPDSGYAVGDGGSFLQTFNGGEDWDCQVMPHRHPELRSVAVPARRQDGDLSAYVAGQDWNTIRANAEWDMEGGFQQWSTDHGLRSVCFPDSLVGFAVGDCGTIVKTSGGGRLRIDFNEQKNCYEAAFRAMWGDDAHIDPLPWFYGFHWWAWWTDSTPKKSLHEPWIMDMCPQQKPAEQVLEDWYKRPSLVPQDTFAWMARHYPTGGLDVVVPANGKVNTPLVLCRLESHNWEEGGSADSARLLQEYYGQGDTVIASDSTTWFPFVEDTTWLFLHGSGRYHFYVQYMDDPNKLSPPYPDFEDTVIVFDSVPPAGSIVVEGGRFASNSTRTLHLSASDSASGVAMMRFTNRGRVNLVRNGGFAAAEGLWSFTSGAYDTSLSMGKLTVGSTQAAVRQFVAPESISVYAGDSCVLETSILAHMHDGDATGEVSFWHFSTNENPEITDTLWQLVDSASYAGDLLSLTGRYNLSIRFLLSTPTPESGWVWQGGMVRVRGQGVDGGTGNVWCDNVGMNAYEPQASGYAWYGPFETLSVWDIGSAAGQHVVGMCLRDSAGAENSVPHADTVVLDPTPPVVDINLPMMGQLVNGSAVEVTGWAYDPIEMAGDTWFSRRTLSFRHTDSTNWLPVSPDSSSQIPAYPDSMASQGPAVHLGYWNTLPLPDGPYDLCLSAADSAGNVSSCTTWVIVDQGFGGGGMRSGPEGGGSGMGEGSCYIGSADGHVLHVSDDLTVLDTFSVNDSGSQAYVTALLEVAEDSLLVLDARGKRVHKLHRSGQHRRRLVSGLSQPVDLKRDSSGNFWLVDRAWNRIGKFRSNGTLVFVRGGLGADSLHFHSPEGIAVKGGLVYVADAGNSRIAVWDTSGHFKTTITGDFENPTAVWVMESGAIYLTDGTDGKLKGITPLGGNIVTIGTADSSKLKGLVPSENRHSLFSLASEPNKVYKLRIQSDESRPGGQQSAGKVNLPKTLALNQPFPNPARTRLNIAYALPRQARVELKLYDVAGKLVTTLANGEQKPGYYNLTWNRQDTKGRRCACGIYFCTLAADNKRFSRKVILTE